MLSRVRIHVALLLLALALLSAFVALDVLLTWHGHDQRLIADSEATLRNEAVRLKSIVETELGPNPQFAERMLMQRSVIPGLQLAAVIDEQGRVLMSTRFGMRGQRAVDAISDLSVSDLRNALSTGEPLIQPIDDMHLGILLSFGHIDSADEVIGHNDGVIILRSDLTERRRALRSEIIREAETKLGLGLLFLLVLAGLLQAWIVGPIRALDAAADAVAAGRRDARIPQGGLLELVRLSQTFAAMRDHLTRALDELGKLNRNLETVIVERTEALRAALERAELASSAKAAFLANMSHEIRTPMSAIIGLSQLSLALPLDRDARNYTEKVLRSAEHLLAVINDILDISRIEAGKIRLDHADFSLADSVDKAMTFVAARAQAKQLDLRLCRADDVPDALVGDSMRLSQILTNLLNNAVKFTEAGHVHLRVSVVAPEPQGLRLRFEIEDTGIGIPDEALPNLFLPFEQGDSSISRRYGGSGLGLAICRQLVELMGGRIEVRSQAGRGSVFEVELPFGLQSHPRTPEVAVKQPISGSLPDPELRGQHVLIVSADADQRNRLRAMLESRAARVDEADSEAGALNSVAAATAGAGYRFILIDRRGPLQSCSLLFAELAQGGSSDQARALVVELVEGGGAPAPEASFDLRISEPGSAAALSAMLSGLVLGGAHADSPAHGPRPVLPRAPDLTGLRVLVAEDNEINQELAASLLRQTRANVRIVDNGERAVQAFVEADFDVVLMDIQMPGLNGIEATRRIRSLKDRKQPFIVAVTANALSGDRERYLQAGMDEYLSKPIDAARLFGLLSGWCRHESKSMPVRTAETVDPGPACLDPLRASGVAVDAAVERLMGNRALYLKLARRFTQERQDWPEQFEAALQHPADGSATALLHSAKSLAGMLGLADLQEQMARLEVTLSSGSSDEALATEVCSGFRVAIALFRHSLASPGEVT